MNGPDRDDLMLEVRDVRKVYPLYRNSAEHLLHLYGFSRLLRKPLNEHMALDGVDFKVRRGERVAIIGSNGAGKSTLLKIISGVTEPSAGGVVMHASNLALLQIGTGFHADLTGRENAEGFARLRGVPKAKLAEVVAETEEFAEIGEYFDQAFSTYSSGMQARVMFSAAVSVEPELLIIDEVLSVGDAYFAQKCVNRLMEVCARTGATLLLVTHNIYEAQRMCERMIWIENGRVRMDGECIPVMNAYEAAVRTRSEAALRKTRAPRSTAYVAGEITRADTDGEPGELHLCELSFSDDERAIARFPLASHAEVVDFELLEDREEGNWGPIESRQGKFARRFERYGSLFHALPFTVQGKTAEPLLQGAARSAQLGCLAPAGEVLELNLFDREARALVCARFVVPPSERWQVASAPLSAAGGQSPADPGERFGTRRVEILGLSVLDRHGAEVTQVGLGQYLRFRLEYRINAPDFNECPLFVFTLVRSGINVAYLWTDQLELAGDHSEHGAIDVVCDPLLIGKGEYNITVVIYRAGYLEETQDRKYFAMDDAIYDMRRRAYSIAVLGPEGGLNMTHDFAIQQPNVWTLGDGQSADGELVRFGNAGG